jgi:hypothetical protein
MAGQSGKRRGPGRQVLGVASLTAVASGTTALVIGMGSAHVSQQLLTSPYADGNAGGPLVVDQPRTNPPAPRTDQTAPSAGQPRTPRAVGIARPVGPVANPPAPVVRPVLPAVDVPGSVDPITAPVTDPTRPLPGQPGRPGLADPGSDDAPDRPDISDPDGDDPDGGDPDSDDPAEVPATPVDPGVPVGSPLCGIDGVGMQLPEDVVRRLEEWLCGTTGRTVTVVAKPLKLVSPVRPGTKVTVPVTVAVRYTPRHAAHSAPRVEKVAKKRNVSAARAQARAESRAASRRHEDRPDRERSRKHEDEHSRQHESRQHGDRSDRGERRRGHGLDDIRDLLQRETGRQRAGVLDAVVRHAEAGTAGRHYTGLHRSR